MPMASKLPINATFHILQRGSSCVTSIMRANKLNPQVWQYRDFICIFVIHFFLNLSPISFPFFLLRCLSNFGNRKRSICVWPFQKIFTSFPWTLHIASWSFSVTWRADWKKTLILEMYFRNCTQINMFFWHAFLIQLKQCYIQVLI